MGRIAHLVAKLFETSGLSLEPFAAGHAGVDRCHHPKLTTSVLALSLGE